MTGEQHVAGRPWPTWQQLVSAAPLGIAVVTFVSIHWPWDLLVVGVVLGYTGLLAVLLRRKRYHWLLGEMLLLFGFILLALFTALAGLAAAILPQPWLPLPVVRGLAAVTVVVGALVAWAPHSRRSR